jgi:hypothetical protein
MIGSSLRIFCLGLAGLLLSWTAFLVLPSFSHHSIASEESWFADAFRPSSRANVIEKRTSPGCGTTLLQLFPFGADLVTPLERLFRHRSEIAAHILPVFLLALAASILAGLLVRERLKFGTGYASPTISFLAKRTAECAILVYFLLTFSPVPLPYWAFYPALGAGVLGTFGYVANLPLRL